MALERIQILITEKGSRIVKESLKGIGSAAFSAGVQVAKFSVIAGAVGAAFAIKQASDFETAMLDVAKTTGIVGDELKGLSNDFLELSKTVPSSGEALAGIGAAAGQLGVKGRDNILAFTEVIAKMATTTDLSTEQAASDLAELSNIFGLPILEAERLGSALNEVSNNTSSNVATLVDFTKRMAPVAKIIGLTAGEVIGFGGTLKELGFQTEAASSAANRLFVQLVAEAETFAQQSGVSIGEFRASIDRDAIGAIKTWGESIKDLPKEELVDALKDVGLASVRTLPVMLELAKNTGRLGRNVDLSSKAFKEATSLQDEFNIQIGSTANQVKLLSNVINALFIDLGNELLPVVNEVIAALVEVANSDETIIFFDNLKLSANSMSESFKGDGASFLNTMKFIISGLTEFVNFVRTGFATVGVVTNILVKSVLEVGLAYEKSALALQQFGTLFGVVSSAQEAAIRKTQSNIVGLESEINGLDKDILNAVKGIVNMDEKFDALSARIRGTTDDQKSLVEGTKEMAKSGESAAESIGKLSNRINSIDAKKKAEDLKEFADISKRIQDSLDLELLNASELDPAVREANTILAGFGNIKPDQKFTDGLIDQIKQIDQVTIAMNARNTAFEEANQIGEEQARSIEGLTGKQQGLADELQRLADIAEITGGTLFDLGKAQESAIIKFGETAKKVVNESDKTTSQVLDAIGKGTEDTLTQVLTTGTITLDSLKSIADSVVEDIIRSFVRAQVQAAITGAKTSGLGGGGEGGGGFGGLIQAGLGLFGFAGGGSAKVGGSGGTDSQLVSFFATPGEDVTVRTPAQQSGAPIPRFAGGGNFQVGDNRGNGTTVVNNSTVIVTKDQNSFRKSRAQIATETERKNSQGRKFI